MDDMQAGKRGGELRKSLRSAGWDLEEALPDRHACHNATLKVLACGLEVNGRGSGERRNHLVRESRNNIGFKNERGYTAQSRREHRRSGGIAADPNHNVRLKFAENFGRGQDSLWKREHRFS